MNIYGKNQVSDTGPLGLLFTKKQDNSIIYNTFSLANNIAI